MKHYKVTTTSYDNEDDVNEEDHCFSTLKKAQNHVCGYLVEYIDSYVGIGGDDCLISKQYGSFFSYKMYIKHEYRFDYALLESIAYMLKGIKGHNHITWKISEITIDTDKYEVETQADD